MLTHFSFLFSSLNAHHSDTSEKIETVKQAEAEAESMFLSGVGTAKQRSALAKGLKECVNSMSAESVSPKDVMDLLLVTQYIDTLSAIGSNELGLRYEPGEVFQIRDGLPTTHHIPDLLS